MDSTNASGVAVAFGNRDLIYNDGVSTQEHCDAMKQEPGERQTQKAPAVDVERFESCDLKWHLFFYYNNVVWGFGYL